MNKLFKTILTTLTICSMAITPVYAMGYSVTAPTSDEAYRMIGKEYSDDHWFTTLLGGVSYYMDTQGSSARAYISDADYKDVLSKEEYCVNWAKGVLPSIVPNGASREEAINIVSNYVNNYLTVPDTYTKEEDFAMQNADYGIKTGKGVCVTYSTMFRGLLSYVPFDSNWKVDFNNENPQWLKVKLVANDTHMWNSIVLDDIELYYDIPNNHFGNKNDAVFVHPMYATNTKYNFITD